MRPLIIDKAARVLILDRSAPATLRVERGNARDLIIQRHGLPGPASPLPPTLKGGFF